MVDNYSWERQETDTEKSYAAFWIYAQMPPEERSLERVVEKLGKRGGYGKHLQRWSSKHNWVTRVSDYQQYLRDRQQELREVYQDEMIANELEDAIMLRGKWLEEVQSAKTLETLTRRTLTDGRVIESVGVPTRQWTEIIKQRDTISAIMRRALGMPMRYEHITADVEHKLSWEKVMKRMENIEDGEYTELENNTLSSSE